MNILQFKCTLLTDIVLSASSANDGVHESLSFIPGACFLGIAASSLYKSEDAHTYELFHSGRVRFGDAHLLYDGVRSIHMPSCLFYPKIRKHGDSPEYYVHHMIDDYGVLKEKQLKQCRSGFCALTNAGNAVLLDVRKDFAIKSAYDSERRRSEDEKMFGYESLCAGQVFAFEVEVDNDSLQNEIVSALCGIKYIGRSRSAQYGQVQIELSSFTNPKPKVSEPGNVVVYADGRLVFYDDNGMPCFRPTAQDLGFGTEAQIVYDKSQLRTFRYSPRNYKRNAFDTERCGFEKGSVFVVSGATQIPAGSYVGMYRSEGFGKVLYNPEFLTDVGANGLSSIRFKKEENIGEKHSCVSNPHTLLVTRLENLKNASDSETSVYNEVNKFVSMYAARFGGESFASQWGTIRGIAMSCKAERIYDEIKEYLEHGIAKDKWDERGRKTCLMEFLKKWENCDVLQDVAINLASQMAKDSKKTR